ncbi:hypothetical protein COCC4DRAFT_56030 [Bipolaris maydis ATCC 48331]|uniref:Uncharacterized protein n=2 Tax=Cochliobolus heterostrophus TaxID=5016 RepID=M2TTY8_COCH5|nr:uncharacterized protein COCC4DRAFT_56030 [Bipolaris maydis ATCC 48331]EMD89994.1 hypothetical protein COCHEDRAFT_1157020 [Bipolaris maydis C5]ENI09792.1 hypothetical protein COCC4DRAFT_56030 [Bipolaris maydis ATCC 48331]
MQLPEVRLLTLQFNLGWYAVSSSAALPVDLPTAYQTARGYQCSQKLRFIALKAVLPQASSLSGAHVSLVD